MNIFATDRDPIKSAQALDDLRLNKMILESVQMLAVALAEHGCPTSELPKKKDGTPFSTKGWRNHPCTVWTRESRANYQWLVAHTEALIIEKFKRTGKLHSMHRNMPGLHSGEQYMPLAGPTEFTNSSMYGKNTGANIIDCYRNTMRSKWLADKRPPKWTNSQAPDWAPEFMRQGHQPLATP
jgi:hypothetical protein